MKLELQFEYHKVLKPLTQIQRLYISPLLKEYLETRERLQNQPEPLSLHPQYFVLTEPQKKFINMITLKTYLTEEFKSYILIYIAKFVSTVICH